MSSANLSDIFDNIDHDSQPLIHNSQYYDTNSFCKLSAKSPKNHLSVFNTNARSLLKHKGEYEVLFQSIKQNCNFEFDIITFTESWLDNSIEHLAKFDGYNMITKHKIPNKEGGGIVIYIKDSIEYKIRHDLSFPTDKNHLFDGIFIEISKGPMSSQSRNVLISVLYRSPSHNSISELTDCFNLILDRSKRENKTIVLAGDLNIDLLKYNSHNQTNQFTNMLVSNNLMPKITLPTRITPTSATLIDHIFSNIDQTKCVAGTIKTDITDHYSSFITLSTQIKRNAHPKFITYRKQDELSLQSLNTALLNTDWSNVLKTSDPNTAYKWFLDTFTNQMNKHLPVVTRRFNKFRDRKEPWITSGILNSLKTKEKLYLQMKASQGKMSHGSDKPNIWTMLNFIKAY